MEAKDLAGLRELIIANAKLIYVDVMDNYATGKNDPHVIIRYSGRSEGPVFQACLIYQSLDFSKVHLVFETEEKTTIEAAMMSLLQRTEPALEGVIDTLVVRIPDETTE